MGVEAEIDDLTVHFHTWFVDADRNVIYTVRDTDFEEENIRMWLEKGNYSIYFSDFEGGSVNVEMSFE